MVVAELFGCNPSADEPAEVMLCSRRGSACPPLFWTSSLYFAASYGCPAADGPACLQAHRCSGRKASSCHATMVRRREDPPTIFDVLQGCIELPWPGKCCSGRTACESQSPRSCFVNNSQNVLHGVVLVQGGHAPQSSPMSPRGRVFLGPESAAAPAPAAPLGPAPSLTATEAAQRLRAEAEQRRRAMRACLLGIT